MSEEEAPKLFSKPSVKLRRNSRGVFWDVVSYADSLDEAKKETLRIDEELLEKFNKKKGEKNG